MSILEILQVGQYVPRIVTNHRWPRRNPLDRKDIARAFVAKAQYRHPTTSDLIRALNSAENLRRICGFVTSGDIPSESTFKPNKRGRAAKGEQREPAVENPSVYLFAGLCPKSDTEEGALEPRSGWAN